MKCLNIALCLLCGFVMIQERESKCLTAAAIARHARSKIGFRTWLYSKNHVTGRNTNKCNIFVADVLKHVGADAPNRWPWYSPIGAREWANPNSTYLTKVKKWSLCTPPKYVPGDVIAENGHVGIVTGTKKTTSSSSAAKPRGLIVENNWGFRPGQSPTCWRLTCIGTTTTTTTTEGTTTGWEPTAIGTGTHTTPLVTNTYAYKYEVTEASETQGPSTTTDYY